MGDKNWFCAVFLCALPDFCRTRCPFACLVFLLDDGRDKDAALLLSGDNMSLYFGENALAAGLSRFQNHFSDVSLPSARLFSGTSYQRDWFMPYAAGVSGWD